MSDLRPCPFCGGAAAVIRELNADTLRVSHTDDCFARTAHIQRFHWNDPARIPADPFLDWNTRASDATAEKLAGLLRKCLTHIDTLEGHLPMNNREDEEVYKDSIWFGEKVSEALAAYDAAKEAK